jgi:hypothetical protein
MRDGSARAVLALPVAEVEQLWLGVAEPSYDLYWQVNRSLREAPSSGKGGGARCRVPIRISVAGEPIVQLPLGLDLASATVRDALAEMLPSLYATAASGTAGPGTPPAVIIQGIEIVPEETPLLWAYDAFAHADNFLYITLMRNDDPDRPTY